MAENKFIISIGRQYGSGGHEIGAKLAEKLGVKFYDNALIDRVSKESGLCKEIIMEHDEKPTSSFLYNLVTDPYSISFNRGSVTDMPYGQKIFLAQYETVKNIASEGPCVIVGRCADYILKDNENLLSIFIYADKDFRLKRIASENPEMSENNLNGLIDKKDRARASYYNYYSDNKWGRASSYDLCINSAKTGIEGAVKLIEDYVQLFAKE